MENTAKTTEFSREEGLKVIYEMIQSAKSSIGRNYFYYLFWGYLVLLASLSDYVLINFIHYPQHYLVWPVLMGIGTVVTIVFSINQMKISKNTTYISTFMRFLWSGWFVSLIILLFFVNMNGDYEMIIPLAFAMYGMAIFISGGIVKFWPMVFGGIIAWTGAVITYFCDYSVQLLVASGIIILAYIIPGHMLQSQSKKSDHVS